MSGHRRRYRRRRSSENWSSGSRSTSRRETDDDDVHGGGHRRRRRQSSSASFPVRRRSPDSWESSWVLLNRPDGDRTPTFGSVMSRTSKGEEISVSLDLVEPPESSILTVDWTRPSTTTPTSTYGNVIAAHRDVVLLTITYSDPSTYPPKTVVDLFVYHLASRLPSLLLLPSSAAAGGHVIYSDKITSGIMSCTSNGGGDDGDSPSFVVTDLQIMQQGKSNVCVFRSWSGQCQGESFKNLHISGADGGCDPHWWSVNAVVPYGRRYMIWVDYYHGMILMDMYSWHSLSPEMKLPPPRLRFVPLPVDAVGDPKDSYFGDRGRPKVSRRVCVTRHGVKFVSIDTQLWSNFGIGNHDVRTWRHRFRITTWSLREDDDDYTWRKDATMHEQEFWDAFNGGDRGLRFQYVEPEFPVVDMDNPDVIVFRLENNVYCNNDPKWMIEVDLRKKVVRAATVYSKESDDLSGDVEAMNSARVSHYDSVNSELPHYMDGGQDCKKRRL